MRFYMITTLTQDSDNLIQIGEVYIVRSEKEKIDVTEAFDDNFRAWKDNWYQKLAGVPKLLDYRVKEIYQLPAFINANELQPDIFRSMMTQEKNRV